MKSCLFACELPDALEGQPVPGELVRASGVWIDAAGLAPLPAGRYPLTPREGWLWLAVEEGEASLLRRGEAFRLLPDETCVQPLQEGGAALDVPVSARCLWFFLAGPLSAHAARAMGALPRRPLKAQAMLGQMLIARHIVRIAARYDGTDSATYQLAQLLYGMLSSYRGEPVAVSAPLSREVGRVVEALRADRYRSSLSLDDMARIAGLPKETFRKRFVAEVGVPPLRYATHFRMQRARELLLTPGSTVAGVAAQVGVTDPYHFSKQFKSVTGISPSEFLKQAADHGDGRVRANLPPQKKA